MVKELDTLICRLEGVKGPPSDARMVGKGYSWEERGLTYEVGTQASAGGTRVTVPPEVLWQREYLGDELEEGGEIVGIHIATDSTAGEEVKTVLPKCPYEQYTRSWNVIGEYQRAWSELEPVRSWPEGDGWSVWRGDRACQQSVVYLKTSFHEHRNIWKYYGQWEVAGWTSRLECSHCGEQAVWQTIAGARHAMAGNKECPGRFVECNGVVRYEARYGRQKCRGMRVKERMRALEWETFFNMPNYHPYTGGMEIPKEPRENSELQKQIKYWIDRRNAAQDRIDLLKGIDEYEEKRSPQDFQGAAFRVEVARRMRESFAPAYKDGMKAALEIYERVRKEWK